MSDASGTERRPSAVDHLPRPKNPAGRNLPVAIGVGAVLGALVLLAVWIGPAGWYPLVAVAVAVATWEVVTRLRERSYAIPLVPMIVMGQVMVWVSWPFGTTGLVAAYVTAVLVAMFGRLFYHGRNAAPQNYLRDTSVAIFVLTWIPLFASFATMISLISSDGVPGGFYIITFMLCVVASDTGGYIAGVMFGSHPMAPAVSPKKSWEGFAGSIIGGVIAGSLTVSLLLGHEWWAGVLLGVGLVICATLGDLVESQFKRELGIKDMSGILPGHGGIMDRIDGMLPSAMVTWLILTILVA